MLNENQGLPDNLPALMFDAIIPVEEPKHPLTRTKRDRADLAQKVVSLIEAGLTNRSGQEPIWRQTWEYMRNEAPSSDVAPADDLPAVHVPIMQTRLDAACSQLTGVVGKQNPLMMCQSMLGEEDSSKKEKLLHRIWIDGGFTKALKDVAQFAVVNNAGFFHLKFDNQIGGLNNSGFGQTNSAFNGSLKWSGVKFSAIRPDEFIIGPDVPNLKDATIVGHRFYLEAQAITELQRLGKYYDETKEFSAATDAEDDELGGIRYARTDEFSFSAYQETKQVECYEVYVKLVPKKDHLSQWFRIVVAWEEVFVLEFEPWPYSRVPYFDCKTITDPTSNFWSAKSIGRSMIPIQDQYNKLESLMYSGALMSANPPIFGPPIQSEDYTQYTPGEYVSIEEGKGGVFSPPTSFRGDAVLSDMANLDRIADSVGKVSTNGLAQEEQKSSITATQSQMIQAGAQNSIMDMIDTFTLNFPEMANFTMEVLGEAKNYQMWSPLVNWDVIPRELLNSPAVWTVTGKNPGDTTYQRYLVAQQLWSIAQNPATQIDLYDLASLMLENCGIPGANKLQKQRPTEAPAPTQEANPGQEMPAPMAGPKPGFAVPQTPSTIVKPSMGVQPEQGNSNE